ncbi:MAG: sigma-70 family RNA polymerase sigma factor [Bryobacteraceae bacterium]
MQAMLDTILEPADDERLIHQAAGGDRAAFGDLYLRYARMVHAILLARVPPADAEDLVQDVFLAAMNRLGELRTAAAFRGWLGAIARRRAIDYFRDGRRRAEFSSGMEQGSPATGGGDRALVTLDLLRRLPEAYRETLIMRLVEGMTGPEIARQTGLTPDSVRVNLCRGMKVLRELWKGDAHA